MDVQYGLTMFDPLTLTMEQGSNIECTKAPVHLFSYKEVCHFLDEAGNLCKVKDGKSSYVFLNAKAAAACKYCLFVVNKEGKLLVLGRDDLRLGILGLSESKRETSGFEEVKVEGSIDQISLTDTYCVALTDKKEFFIWGTTLDHFFGENISQTHFTPTKLTIMSTLAIEKIFCSHDTLFLVSERNEIECFTRFTTSGATRGVGDQSSQCYRIPRFCDGTVSQISQFSRFTCILSDSGELHFYDKQDKEIHLIGKGFSQVSSSKNKFIALKTSTFELHIYSASLYAHQNFSALDKKILKLGGFSTGLLIHQPRLNNKLVIIDRANFIESSASICKPVTEARSKPLVFENSYVRMKYNEIKENVRVDAQQSVAERSTNKVARTPSRIVSPDASMISDAPKSKTKTNLVQPLELSYKSKSRAASPKVSFTAQLPSSANKKVINDRKSIEDSELEHVRMEIDLNSAQEVAENNMKENPLSTLYDRLKKKMDVQYEDAPTSNKVKRAISPKLCNLVSDPQINSSQSLLKKRAIFEKGIGSLQSSCAINSLQYSVSIQSQPQVVESETISPTQSISRPLQSKNKNIHTSQEEDTLYKSGESFPIRSLASHSQSPSPEELEKNKFIADFNQNRLSQITEESQLHHNEIDQLKAAMYIVKGSFDLNSPDPSLRDFDIQRIERGANQSSDLGDKGYEVGWNGSGEFKRASESETPRIDEDQSIQITAGPSIDYFRISKDTQPSVNLVERSREFPQKSQLDKIITEAFYVIPSQTESVRESVSIRDSLRSIKAKLHSPRKFNEENCINPSLVKKKTLQTSTFPAPPLTEPALVFVTIEIGYRKIEITNKLRRGSQISVDSKKSIPSDSMKKLEYTPRSRARSQSSGAPSLNTSKRAEQKAAAKVQQHPRKHTWNQANIQYSRAQASPNSIRLPSPARSFNSAKEKSRSSNKRNSSIQANKNTTNPSLLERSLPRGPTVGSYKKSLDKLRDLCNKDRSVPRSRPGSTNQSSAGDRSGFSMAENKVGKELSSNSTKRCRSKNKSFALPRPDFGKLRTNTRSIISRHMSTSVVHSRSSSINQTAQAREIGKVSCRIILKRLRWGFVTIKEEMERKKTVRNIQTLVGLKSDLSKLKRKVSNGEVKQEDTQANKPVQEAITLSNKKEQKDNQGPNLQPLIPLLHTEEQYTNKDEELQPSRTTEDRFFGWADLHGGAEFYRQGAFKFRATNCKVK